MKFCELAQYDGSELDYLRLLDRVIDLRHELERLRCLIHCIIHEQLFKNDSNANELKRNS